MSRVQVLDVGDRVRQAGLGYDGVVVDIAMTPSDVLYNVDWGWNPARAVLHREGWSRAQLQRIGDPLQVGDFVRVNSRIEPTSTMDWTDVTNALGVIVDEYMGQAPDFMVAIPALNDLYECGADQLTRITRAEALA